jgi:hypothetical protein
VYEHDNNDDGHDDNDHEYDGDDDNNHVVVYDNES